MNKKTTIQILGITTVVSGIIDIAIFIYMYFQLMNINPNLVHGVFPVKVLVKTVFILAFGFCLILMVDNKIIKQRDK